MKFPDPLLPGTLIRRYKRFLADVTLESGAEITAHCANPGSMLGLAEPGMEVWLSPARNPNRKLHYSWELVRVGDGFVGVHTAHPNRIVAEAVDGQKIPELAGYRPARREVPYGKNSRIDLLLQGDGRPDCYVEIKSVTLRRNGSAGRDAPAEFPDAVTARGTKHLVELSEMVRGEARAVMCYLVQREDCAAFAVAADIDPAYAEALGTARQSGVETICYACSLTTEAIEIAGPLPVRL
jgi:sugar fermentation stimulation protein A